MGQMRINTITGAIVIGLLAVVGTCRGQTALPSFADEPVARATYDQMIAAFRAAQTLHWNCTYKVTVEDHSSGRSYEVWLAKPNFFRVEAVQTERMDEGGVLVGDGEAMWKYWPQGGPKSGSESDQQHRQTSRDAYMTKPAPLAKHSIGHEMTDIGLRTILDPSAFHGCTDPLAKYIDGVRALPAETVNGEECDVIEVSFMKGLWNKTLWIARSDHLPRRLKQLRRTMYDVTTEEHWSNVTVNEPIPASQFSWKPPEGWQVRPESDPNSGLPKPGTVARDFALAGGDDKTIRLSSYRGQVVLIYVWSAGVPQCREGMGRLQTILDQCGSQGFAILGFNDFDNREIALEELRRQGVGFPSVIDDSEEAWDVHYKGYPDAIMPTYYLIDRQGRIAEAWSEDDHKNTHLVSALAKLGITPATPQATAPAE